MKRNLIFMQLTKGFIGFDDVTKQNHTGNIHKTEINNFLIMHKNKEPPVAGGPSVVVKPMLVLFVISLSVCEKIRTACAATCALCMWVYFIHMYIQGCT